MPIPIRIWRRALARAAFLAISLTGTPAAACPALTLAGLAERLTGAARYDFGPAALTPFLALWADRGGGPLPGEPDGVALFARAGQPILVAFGQAGCLLALLPTPRADLWRSLRLHVGRIA